MKKERKLTVMLVINLVLLALGPIAYVAYAKVVSHFPEQALSLFVRRESVSVILASFAFTMLGFLAAVITILFSLSQTRAFRKYKSGGYLTVFFSIYYCAIACLMLTFLTALLSLAGSNGVWPMRISLMFTVTSLAQIAALLTTIINLSGRN